MGYNVDKVAMISRKVWIILISGCVLIALLIFIAVSRFLIPGLPEGYIYFSSSLQNTFYWSIPLILIIFISPFVYASSTRPDIHFSFDIARESNDNKGIYSRLLVTVENRGGTTFSFNRVQFYVPKSKIAFPEDGIIRGAGVRKAGVHTGSQGNWNAGWLVERGIPVVLSISYPTNYDYLGECMKKAPRKPVKIRLYYHGTNIKAESRNALSSDDLETLIPPSRWQSGPQESLTK